MLRTTQKISSHHSEKVQKKETKKTKDIQEEEISEDAQEEDCTNDEHDQDRGWYNVHIKPGRSLGRLDWVHIMKSERSWWKNADTQHHKIGWNTVEAEMATNPADRYPETRRTTKAAEWNLGLIISTRSQRKAERPARWLNAAKKISEVERMKNNARYTLTAIEEPNSSHHDDLPHHQQPQRTIDGEDPVLFTLIDIAGWSDMQHTEVYIRGMLSTRIHGSLTVHQLAKLHV